MSCPNHRAVDPRRERSCMDNQCPNYCFSSSTCTAAYKNHRPDVCRSGSYSERIVSEYKTTGIGGTEVSTEGRGDPPFPDMNMQMGRIPGVYTRAAPKQRESVPNFPAPTLISVEKIQARLKVLEENSVIMQTRMQNLVAENDALRSRLEEEAGKSEEFEKTIASLQEEREITERHLSIEKEKFAELLMNQEKSNVRPVKDSKTSSTDSIKTSDRGVQMWAVCTGCQRKLESCEKEPPTVTITKSELEVLENDMQVLRDAVIAREEAWDKAMEREQIYRQQITRLNSEAITERHISESHLEKLKTVTDTLAMKESEIRTIQKETQYLNKLIAKLGLSLRDATKQSNGGAGFEINEKDQKAIDDIVRRVSSAKNKQKGKSRSTCSDKASNHQHCSPRGGKDPRSNGKD